MPVTRVPARPVTLTRDDRRDDGRDEGHGRAYDRAEAGPAPRVARPGGARPRLRALRDGPDGPAPRRARDQRATCTRRSAELLWIIDIYGFMVAGFLITMGTLGDRIGRRQAAPDRRGGLRGPVDPRGVLDHARDAHRQPRAPRDRRRDARALDAVADLRMFQDPRSARVAIGVWISAFSAGSAIGPVLGGILLEYFWWGSVFLLALPVMAAAADPRARRPARVPRPGRRAARPAERRACRSSRSSR